MSGGAGPDEDKRAIVAETFAPGAVILAVARCHQVSSGQIHTWRKQLRAELGFPAPAKSERPVQFMPLAIAASNAPSPVVEVEAGGMRMKITGAADADFVATIVKALSRR